MSLPVRRKLVFPDDEKLFNLELYIAEHLFNPQNVLNYEEDVFETNKFDGITLFNELVRIIQRDPGNVILRLQLLGWLGVLARDGKILSCVAQTVHGALLDYINLVYRTN
jgi:hypothetical protein